MGRYKDVTEWQEWQSCLDVPMAIRQTLSEMDEITRRLKKRLETVIHKEDNPVSCYSCLEEETDINNPKISCDMLPLHATRQLCNEDSKCVDSNVGNRNDQFRKSQSQDLQRVVYTKHPFESSQKALDIKCGVPHQRKEATSEEEIQDKQSVPIKNPSSSIFRQEEGAVGGSTSTDCLMQMAAEEDGLENIFNPMLFQHLLSCYRDTYQCILGTAPGIHTGEEKQHVAFPYRGGQNKFMTEQDKGKIVGNDMNITHNFVCADKESNPIGEYKNQTFRSKNINQTFYSGDIIYSSTERLVDTGTLLASGDTKAQVTRYLSLLHNEHRPHSECDTKLSSSKEAIIKESTQEGNLEMKMGFTNDKEDTIMPSQTFPIDNGGDGIDQCSNVNSKLNNVNKQFDELSKSRIASDKLVTEEQNSTADILGKSYLEESQSKGNFVNSESESPVEVHLVSQTQEIPVEIDNREVEMSSLTTSTTITAATLPQPTTTTTTTRQEDTMCTDRSHGGVHQATPLLIDRDEIRRIAKIFNPRMKDSHTY
ncbi:uncharacterized protein [Anabrus simplex]|uniref:uncharacterized protein n=1 Tax=Anabrus simplex TaxID=316456 RepID=UPI0035A39EA0